LTIQSISEEVRRIQKKYGESDPFRLAQAMKIIVVLKPMGRYKGCCKGFYVQHRRIKHITINSDLPEVIQRVILAHEIAHSVLHTNITAAFHEFTLFDDTDRQGYEANIFAAALLSDAVAVNDTTIATASPWQSNFFIFAQPIIDLLYNFVFILYGVYINFTRWHFFKFRKLSRKRLR